ncbi:hypothetical protein S7711_00750 [Stachybotrys chartarum IBT 7711]|uniref:BZIP domain-containing protein n=1 Tax=Stachybotrys chartarum (strain CBS 109288 / IBT 7711) TaxID=1280523 RepID=A0A084B029_STACB|nr:hypothetical protein S7711_00750 [Stachybotrys chartarum IBT 7711]
MSASGPGMYQNTPAAGHAYDMAGKRVKKEEYGEAGTPALNAGTLAHQHPNAINMALPAPQQHDQHSPFATYADNANVSYNQHPQQQQQQQKPLMPNLRPLSEVLIAGCTLASARLCLPSNMAPHDKAAMHARVLAELSLHEARLPVLPASRIPALPPKPRLAAYVEIPEGDERERQQARAFNNAISDQSQTIERQRNNMAAKKSRAVRVESLDNARRMLVDQAAELCWMRTQLVMAGGDPAAYDRLPAPVRAGMRDNIAARVASLEDQNKEAKKRAELQARATLTRKRKADEHDDDDDDDDDEDRSTLGSLTPALETTAKRRGRGRQPSASVPRGSSSPEEGGDMFFAQAA